MKAINEHKTVDVWTIAGKPVEVTTWLLTYEDGRTEVVQRKKELR